MTKVKFDWEIDARSGQDELEVGDLGFIEEDWAELDDEAKEASIYNYMDNNGGDKYMSFAFINDWNEE